MALRTSVTADGVRYRDLTGNGTMEPYEDPGSCLPRLAQGDYTAETRRLLRGHDLACRCPLDQPCHTDVLLELVS